jgi:hypothetical protein
MITDLVDPQELIGYARSAQLEEERNRLTLSNYLPNDTTPDGDIEFRVTRGAFRDQDAATVRAWDTEAPIAARQGVGKIMGELLPVSRKIPLGEEERLRKRGLERGLTGSANAALVDAIYNDAENMAKAVANRFELFRGEVLVTGKVTLNENGVAPPVVDFGRKAGHTVVLLTTTRWSDYGGTAPAYNSDPIGNMRTWVQAYIDANGVAPGFALTSTRVISTLMQHPAIRSLVAGPGGMSSIVTVDTVNAALQAFGLPALVPYDTVVRVAGTQTRPIADDKVILMPPVNERAGATLFGTTAEAIDLAEARLISQDQCPGMVVVPMKESDPVRTWTLATAVGFPVLTNPDLTFAAQVL